MIRSSSVFVLALAIASTAAVPLNKRIAQTISASTAKWEAACRAAGGGLQCNPVSVTAFTTLLAAAGPCDQQNSADAMIDLAKTLKSDPTMITLTQIFAQQPRNTPSSQSVQYCQQAPRNPELNGLFQCQFQGANPTTFVGGVAVGAPGTIPFGMSSPLSPPGSCPAHTGGPIADGTQLVDITQDPGVQGGGNNNNPPPTATTSSASEDPTDTSTPDPTDTSTPDPTDTSVPDPTATTDGSDPTETGVSCGGTSEDPTETDAPASPETTSDPAASPTPTPAPVGATSSGPAVAPPACAAKKTRSISVNMSIAKRIAQTDLGAVAQSWQDLCLASGGDIHTNDPCVKLAGLDGLNALLAGADPCAQQDIADQMIDFANSPGINNRDALIANARTYRAHPRNALDVGGGLIPSTPYCEKAPKNQELVGIVNGQLNGVNPGLFGGPKFPVIPFGAPGTCPFEQDPDVDTCTCK